MAELRRNSPHFCSMPDPKDSVKHLYFSELDSTQAWAHENPDSWCPSGWTAITAGTQRQGRGSGGSTWTDVPGSSLLMTLVSPAIEWSAPYVFVRHAQASLCTAEWLQVRGVEARLKWPNDLYLNRLKLGGFLTEAYWSQGLCTRWFLGLGLNLTEAPEGAAAAPGLQRDGLAEDLAGHLAAALSRPVGATCSCAIRRNSWVGKRNADFATEQRAKRLLRPRASFLPTDDWGFSCHLAPCAG